MHWTRSCLAKKNLKVWSQLMTCLHWLHHQLVQDARCNANSCRSEHTWIHFSQAYSTGKNFQVAPSGMAGGSLRSEGSSKETRHSGTRQATKFGCSILIPPNWDSVPSQPDIQCDSFFKGLPLIQTQQRERGGWSDMQLECYGQISR